jgi:purine-binding chemotaxis protein CheW
LTSALVVRIGGTVGALPLRDVIETFRPLPIEPLRGMPPFVRGVALVRGTPTAVVDLSHLLTGTPGEITRFVSVRVESRCIALAVEAVLGVRVLANAVFGQMPPLLDRASEQVAALGKLDGHLLVMLQASRSLLDDTLRALETQGGVA